MWPQAVLAFSLLLFGTGASAVIEVDSLERIDPQRAQVVSSFKTFNRRTSATTFEITVTNVSGVPLDGSLFLTIPATSPDGIAVTNADETTSDGTPAFLLIEGGSMAEGESRKVDVTFANGRLRFSFDTAVFLDPALADTTPPALTITSPVDGSLRNSSPILVSGEVDDPGATVEIDGVAIALTPGTPPTFEANVELAEGTNTLVVTATDAAGNTAVEAVSVTLDTAAPDAIDLGTLSFSGPDEGVVRIEGGPGTVEPDARVTATNLRTGDTVTVGADATGAIVLEIAAGAEDLIAFVVVDAAGNRSPDDGTALVIDRTPPVIVVASPAEGEDVGTTNVTVTGTVDDPEAVVDVNGAPATLDGNSFTAIGVSLPDEGLNTLTVTARDRAGNAASRSITVVRDTVAPEIVFTAPDEAGLQTGDSIEVAGTLSERASVAVNGVAVTPATGATTFAGSVPLVEGINVLTAVATDSAGNVTTASVQITRDTTAPAVSIETPTAGRLLTTLAVDVGGIVNDLVPGTTIDAEDCRVFVNGIEARVSNGSFLASGVRLQQGVNTISAEAIDRAGNRTRTAIQVRVLGQTGQRLVPVAGSGQEGPVNERLPRPLTVALVDANGSAVPGQPVTFRVTRGAGKLAVFPDEGATITVRTDQNGLARAVFTPGGRAGAGNHRVLATARGFLGEAEFCVSATPKGPARLAVSSGFEQRGAVGEILPEPLAAFVTDEGGNAVEGASVRFTVQEGGGSFAGGGGKAVVTTNADGLASVDFRLGPDPGIANNLVAAQVVGHAGLGAASFTATGLAAGRAADTTLSGIVVDNQDNPIPGATARVLVPGQPNEDPPTAQSDAQGQFTVRDVPVGRIRLIVDGSSTSRPGRWPEVEFDLTAVSGQDNTIGMPVYLPRLADNAVRVRSGGPPTDITLRLPGVDGAELTVFANSVTCPHGAAECELSWTQVNRDRVPMAPPEGGNPALATTFQPAGAHFDAPVRACYPNLDRSPGEQAELYSFDHDLGEFVAIGPGTVTADGAQLCSDPGFGIVKGGWFFAILRLPLQPLVTLAGALPEFPDLPLPDLPPFLNPPFLETPDPPDESRAPEATDEGADPVILATGELVVSATDLRIPGRGFDWEMKRTYRSQYNYDGPMGHNWEFNYNERLLLPEPGGPVQDVRRCNGAARLDTYTANADGSFSSPDAFYDRLFRNPDGSFTIRDRTGFRRNFDADGRLASYVDRNGNTMTFEHDAEGRLVRVVDTLGRPIDYAYDDNGRLSRITDFAGRELRYFYDENRDLVAARSPVVVGTSIGNDFPDGKTTRYEYSSGFDESANPRLGLLNHNLTAIIDPKGQHYLQNTYGTDPDAYDFDRIVRQREGAPDQIWTLAYEELNPDQAGNAGPDVPRNRTTVTDRNGNRRVHIHNAATNLIEHQVFTNRDVNPDDPDVFVTRHEFNADSEKLVTIHPEGNRIEYDYDDENPDRFQQGNLLSVTRVPGPRGGDQDRITISYTYEPIYNRRRSVTGPRGNDPTFQPQNGGSTSPGRYTTTRVFDYQEDDSVAALAAELRRSETEVAALLDTAGIALGLGDLNDDGNTDRINGNVVRRDEPTVRLLADSREAALDGDAEQEIVWTYTYNRFGQRTSETDPEGNVDDYLYHPERDPDGDGVASASPRSLAGDTGGYLAATVQDSRTSARRASMEPLTRIRNELFYDTVGNVIRKVDGRGNPTVYEVNALNQVLKTTLEPPFLYQRLTFYDSNNNVVREEIENRDTNGPRLDDFVTYTYEHDILDYVVRKTEEVSVDEILVTEFRYDSNQNRTEVVEPEGNRHRRVYDERDLVFTDTRGFASPGASTTTYTYDGNRNRIRTVDAEDNTGDGANDPTLESYDGFDRRIRTVDAVGNAMEYVYDPASNVVAESYFGRNGGPSPTNNSGAANVLLARSEVLFDELSREFQSDRVLFANTTPVGPDGPLTPGDGKATMRYEYDRNSRRTRTLNDNDHEMVTEYDGVDRVVRTVDQLDNELRYRYDDNHNRTETTEVERSPEGLVPDETFVTTYEYDSIDRLTAEIDNLGNRMQYIYDSRDNVTGIVDQMGNTRTYTWDGIDRKLAEIKDLRIGGTGDGIIDTTNPANPDGRITRLRDWDRNSRLVSETDDNGNVTRYDYDALNRKIRDIFADGTTNTYIYDRDHNVREFTDENGSIQRNTYDGINRLTRKDVERAPDVVGTTLQTFEYDGLSRLTRGTDNNDPLEAGDDSVLTFDYDSLSRQLVEVQDGHRVARVYDGVGNRIALVYPNGRRIETTYDDLERMDVIRDATDGGRLIADYDYIGPHRVLERRYGNGTRLTYHDDAGTDIGYDGLKRRIGIFHKRDDGTLIAGFEHAFDKEDNRRFEKDLVRGTVDVFEYDSAYRLTRSALELPPDSVGGIENNETVNSDVFGLGSAVESNYRLDGVGNWLMRDRDGVTISFTVNEMNEYGAIGATPQTHDDNGNLAINRSLVYEHDFSNRLTRIIDRATGEGAQYIYDALDRRVSKNGGGSLATRFLYDDAHSIEEQSPNGDVLRAYVIGATTDELLELSSDGGESFFYHSNFIGSVMALSDTRGNGAERYQYREYGSATVSAAIGLSHAGTSNLGNPFQFSGRRFDSESNLHFFRNRYFDARRGRFIQRDPKGYEDGMGLYEYVDSNPINLVDPFGTQSAVAQRTQGIAENIIAQGIQEGGMVGAAKKYGGAAIGAFAVGAVHVADPQNWIEGGKAKLCNAGAAYSETSERIGGKAGNVAGALTAAGELIGTNDLVRGVLGIKDDGTAYGSELERVRDIASGVSAFAAVGAVRALPRKRNRGGKLQPWNRKTGQFMSYSAGRKRARENARDLFGATLPGLTDVVRDNSKPGHDKPPTCL